MARARSTTPQPSVVIRRVGYELAKTAVATANLILAEQPDRIFSLRERRKMGIKYVRAAGADELPSTLAAAAARTVLADDAAESIDLLATATTTPSDFEMWSLPAKVASLIGAKRAACIGFGETGCAAPFAALRVLLPVMLAPEGPARVLLSSAAVTPGDHFFAPDTVVGDGAGAILLDRVVDVPPGCFRLIRAELVSDSSLVDAFGCDAGLVLLRERKALVAGDYTLHPRDPEKFRAVGERNAKAMEALLRASVQRAGWRLPELRWLVPDNVALQIALELGDRLELPKDRVFTQNCMQVGHMWGVDLFVNLATVVNELGVEPGDRLACAGYGLGSHYGVLLLEAT